MRHLLTYFKKGEMSDGLLCPVLDSCRRCFLRCKDCCGEIVGELVKCKFGNLYYKCFDELCFVGIHPLMDGQAKEYIDFDLDVILMSYVVHALQEYSDKYDAELNKLNQFVSGMAVSHDDSRNGRIKLKEKIYTRLKNYIANLNAITQEVSSSISLLDDKVIKLPCELKRDLDLMPLDLRTVAKIDNNEPFSLEHLRKLTEEFKLPSLDMAISGQTVLTITRLSKAIGIIQNKFAMFNDWIHDVNHYMSRIQMLFPSADGTSKACEITEDGLRSLDALVGALKILKSEFEEELGISKGPGEVIRQAPFEIFKLFHKYRYCFYQDNVYFVPSRNRFTKKVRSMPGIGTVALNLYHNAVKYLNEYPGRHDITTEFEEGDDGVRIIISSMGPVVTKDECEHLGEKGFRAAAARKSHRGNGKGLARVVKVCQNCGLTYKFLSDRKGVDEYNFARFTVTITIPNELFVE